MKKFIYPIIILTILFAVLAYRYFLVPTQIQKKYSAKLIVNKTISNPKTKTIVKTSTKKKKVKPVASPANIKCNLLKNSSFDDNIKNWHLWKTAKKSPENIKVVQIENNNSIANAVRIENPNKQLIGLSQPVLLTSGLVYRLSGTVRSLGNDNSKIFGGRIAVYLPPQKEKQIIWMTEYNSFWEKELFFTNLVTGAATVYFHLGYGGVATTGEFANIRLEKIKTK